MVVSRGAVGSAVCGRTLRDACLTMGELGEPKRPPWRRQLVLRTGDDIGGSSADSLMMSAGMGESEVGCGGWSRDDVAPLARG